MSNNEWNRLVGKRWRELTPKEHEPFRQMALLDKKRYEAVRTTSYTDTLSSGCALDYLFVSTLFIFRSVLRLVSQWKSESSKLLSALLTILIPKRSQFCCLFNTAQANCVQPLRASGTAQLFSHPQCIEHAALTTQLLGFTMFCRCRRSNSSRR